jgi:NAD(P)-dependent dehydrogenase (short-subunit alcohol dehydrogenase family)
VFVSTNDAALRGRVVLLTGASSGLGHALALEFARRGACLALHARDAARLEAVRAECAGLGARSLAITGDVRDPQDCCRLVDSTLETFGRIDYLVLNAGIGMWAELAHVEDLGAFRTLIETNYLGAVNCTVHALPHVIAARGLVAVISSIQGRIGVHRHTGYAASKHALQGFFDSLRIELEGSGVDVLMVYPTWLSRTRLRERALGPDGRPGGAPTRSESGAVDVAHCATRVANAICARSREIFVPRHYALLPWLRVLCPRWVERLVRARAR